MCRSNETLGVIEISSSDSYSGDHLKDKDIGSTQGFVRRITRGLADFPGAVIVMAVYGSLRADCSGLKFRCAGCRKSRSSPV